MKDKGLGPFRCILRIHRDQMYPGSELTFPVPVLLGDKSSKTEFICTVGLGKGWGLSLQAWGGGEEHIYKLC